MKTNAHQFTIAQLGAVFALVALSGCGVLLGGYGDEPPDGAGGSGGNGESSSSVSSSVGGGSSTGGGSNTGGNGFSCEATLVKVELGEAPFSFIGSTMNEKDRFAPVITANCAQTTSGPEHVHEVTVGADGILTAMTVASGTTFDSVLYARKATCADGATEFCADRSSAIHDLLGGEVLSFPVKAGEVWHIIVDGYDDTANGKGDYELKLSLRSGLDATSVVPVRIELGSAMTLRGAVGDAGQNDVFTGTCGGQGELVYQIEYGTGVQKIKFEASPLVNTLALALYATKAAPDSFVSPDVGCNAVGCNEKATISTTPGIAYLVVDGGLPGFNICNQAGPGSFNLVATPSATP